MIIDGKYVCNNCKKEAEAPPVGWYAVYVFPEALSGLLNWKDYCSKECMQEFLSD